MTVIAISARLIENRTNHDGRRPTEGKMNSNLGTVLATMFVVFGTFVAEDIAAQGNSADERQERARRLMAAPNPIEPIDSVWIEELTYIEVRDRIADGSSTAIIPTAGIEENGPYLATGKHNYIMRAVCPALAQELGNALCAPVVPFVPQGDLDPLPGSIFFPGTFGLRQETYQALLEDIATSLKLHGFSDIVMIGDSGGNQRGMKAAAEHLNRQWAGSGVRVHFIGEFYSPGWEDTEKYTEEVLGAAQTKNDGHHDDMWVTAMMMVTDPKTVRHEQRVEADLATINGFDISDLEQTVELGRQMVAYRARSTAEAIRKAIE
jgi:creatinine amidohydrolase/Fe(II)-dependent formamide hydrolase-like protein